MGEARRKAQAVQPRPGETPEQWDERVDKILDASGNARRAYRVVATPELIANIEKSGRNPETVLARFARDPFRIVHLNRAIKRSPVTK